VPAEPAAKPAKQDSLKVEQKPGKSRERTMAEIALDAARDIMSHDVRSGLLDLTSFIEVEDEQHELIFTLTFVEAVTIASQYKDHRPKR
jgi:hypothetical protein